MKKEFELIINLKEKATGKDAFAKTYRIAMWDEFVKNTNIKGHSLLTHTDGFVTQLKLHALPLAKKPLKKREIYIVNYAINQGSEIIGLRPSIVFKELDGAIGEDVTVIPLTSMVADKLADKYDIQVQKDDTNKLYQNSYARLRQMRAVSLKRIGKPLGVITDHQLRNQINDAMKEMLAIEK